ncbi:MAG: sulfotransferase, partial [Gammaproteobacteria bacterium]
MSLAQAFSPIAVRTLNRGGRILQRAGIVTPDLRQETLVAAAKHRARLEEFGRWPIEEPLDRLLSAYEREAELTTLGRITVRQLLVTLLENLLYLEQERQSAPEIEQQTIDAPVFIIGLPRTGTTLLHGLIAQDPATRTPLTWEVMFPAGYPESPDAINRIRKRTDSRLAWANRLVPAFRRIHTLAADLPQECIAIMAQGFASIQFHTTHNVPSYQDWFELEAQELGYAFHYRFLQHLQARRAGNRWVLKAPGHLFGLDALLQRYPDARIIQTHRDPLKVMASIASLATVLRRAFSDSADPKQIAADWCNRWETALSRSLDIRDRWPAERFFDIAYADLVAEPLTAVERLYEFLGWPLSSQAR